MACAVAELGVCCKLWSKVGINCGEQAVELGIRVHMVSVSRLSEGILWDSDQIS